MKYRRANASKIKYQHAMIQGLRKFLEAIEDWDEIASIIPAQINRTKGSATGLRITVQTQTPSGIKCLARASGCVQEVFITTPQPEDLIAKLTSEISKR